jgi:hypothetical protein
MSGASLDESDIAAELLHEQFKALLRRHSFEDIVLVRVLVEHYNEVAATAKRGDLVRARRDLNALQARISIPPSDEIKLILASFALPVSALIYWQLGEHQRARDDLVATFDACAELVRSYGHAVHGGRQLHQGVNYARVLLAEGKAKEAAALVTSLRAVSAGDRSSWPFNGADTLTLPITGDWRRAIDMQLDMLESDMSELPS